MTDAGYAVEPIAAPRERLAVLHAEAPSGGLVAEPREIGDSATDHGTHRRSILARSVPYWLTQR